MATLLVDLEKLVPHHLKKAQGQISAKRGTSFPTEQLPLIDDNSSGGALCSLADIGDMEGVRTLLEGWRKSIQPKRPGRLDPTKEYSYDRVQAIDAQINLNLYSRFARAFAASAIADRSTPLGAKEMLRLPSINQVADEAIAFVAMLEFAKAVDKIEQACHGQNKLPSDFWSDHRKTVQTRLLEAKKCFDATIESLHLRVTAGDRGFSTNPHYNAFIHAENALLDAKNFGQMVNAIKPLKEHAFEFILGGTDKAEKGRGEVHHKFLRRVDEAYKKDKAKIAKDEAEHQRDCVRAIDKGGMRPREFENPFTAIGLHTLNRVYEARFAMAVDDIASLLPRKKAANDPSGASRPRAAALGFHTERLSVPIPARNRGGRGGDD